MNFLVIPRGYVQVFKNKMIILVPSKELVIVKEALFSHPRMVVGDFVMAEQLLREGLKEAYPARLLQPRPRIIMQPKELIEGGVTMIEERVLQELALGAGARQAKVWVGPDLAKEEVEAFRF